MNRGVLQHRIFKTPGHSLFLLRALVGLESYVQQFGTVTNWHAVFRDCVERAAARAGTRRSQR